MPGYEKRYGADFQSFVVSRTVKMGREHRAATWGEKFYKWFMAIYLARVGASKEKIRARMAEYYPSVSGMTVDAIRRDYGIDGKGPEYPTPKLITIYYAFNTIKKQG